MVLTDSPSWWLSAQLPHLLKILMFFWLSVLSFYLCTIRFLAYKALEYTPGPLRGLLAAVLKPWGIASRAPTPAAAVALGGAPGTKEAELARLMGWPVG
jgi:hypothetical protein